jgi:hypothetical protein
MKMEAKRFFQTPVGFEQTTRLYILEDKANFVNMLSTQLCFSPYSFQQTNKDIPPIQGFSLNLLPHPSDIYPPRVSECHADEWGANKFFPILQLKTRFLGFSFVLFHTRNFYNWFRVQFLYVLHLHTYHSTNVYISKNICIWHFRRVE